MAPKDPDRGLYKAIGDGQRASAVLSSSPNLKGPLGSVEKLIRLIASASPQGLQNLEAEIDSLAERLANPDHALSPARHHVDYEGISAECKKSGYISEDNFRAVADDLYAKAGFLTPKLIQNALELPSNYQIKTLLQAYAKDHGLVKEKIPKDTVYYKKSQRPVYLASVGPDDIEAKLQKLRVYTSRHKPQKA